MNYQTRFAIRSGFIATSMMALVCVSHAAGPQVFFTDFESGIPSEIDPQVALTTGVQGYSGLGYPDNQFAGSFLRSPTGNAVTLTLTDLPPHDVVSVHFLFAAIDSLDGTGVVPPEGDFFRVAIDGGEIP